MRGEKNSFLYMQLLRSQIKTLAMLIMLTEKKIFSLAFGLVTYRSTV